MAAAPGAIFIATAPPHAAARLFKLFSAEAAVFIGIETFEHPRHAGLAPALLHRRQLICAEHAIAIGIGARQHAVDIASCAERGGSDQLITAEIAIAIGIGMFWIRLSCNICPICHGFTIPISSSIWTRIIYRTVIQADWQKVKIIYKLIGIAVTSPNTTGYTNDNIGFIGFCSVAMTNGNSIENLSC